MPEPHPTGIDAEVLVVGAGPTGLMLANELVRRGVRTMIIDRHAGPTVQTRALVVHARTLEIYSRLGIVGRALELGKRVGRANLWSGRRVARIPVGDIGQDLSPFPFLLILGQDDNERLLGDALRGRGGDVDWNTELVALEQDDQGVTARLAKPDGTSTGVRVSWVAGCDGAHSAVRELNAVPFQGAPYEHVFFVADAQLTGSMVPNELNVYLRRKGFNLFFPMRGADHWRVVGILPPHLKDRNDLSCEDVFPTVRAETGAGLSLQGCNWYSSYRIHHRCAARFRAGRCFLLGDAAHIHSPVGAQGMNTGLQDAYNLGWKLAMVVSGQADADLLDSYEDERIRVARRLLATTDRAFSLIVSDTWLAGMFRTHLVARVVGSAMRFDRVRKRFFRTVSQIGIKYPSSPLSNTLAGLPERAPRAGDRFPWLRLKLLPGGPIEDLFERLDDRRLNLIVIGQAAPPELVSALGGRMQVIEIPDDPGNEPVLGRAQLARPSFYLVRPDGHVGLAGSRLDAGAVTRYVSARLRLRDEAPQDLALAASG